MKKLKKFNVSYSTTMYDEVVIKAKSEKEALDKFNELELGIFDNVWELGKDNESN